MIMIKAPHTLCVFSENSPGLLLRVTVLFTRRKMNIESLTVSETERAGISRFTIVVHTDTDTAHKVARQIKRIVDVHEVFVCQDDELIASEVAMFKVAGNDRKALDRVITEHDLSIKHEYEGSIVLQRTGTESENDSALAALRPFGVAEFVRSGRIGIRRDGVSFTDHYEVSEREPEPDAEVWI